MKTKRKLMLVVLIPLATLYLLFCLFTFLPQNVYAETVKLNAKNSIVNTMSTYATKTKNERLYDLTTSLITVKLSENGNRQISAVKQLKDFDDNDYTLFELAPTGYIIYHNESGTYFEYSQSSQSPYLGLTDNLYYGSMMEYYQKVNGTYISTLDSSKILQQNDRLALIEECKIVEDKNNANSSSDALSYINGNLSTTALNSKMATEINSQITPLSANNQPAISMESFFTPLTTRYNMGYNDGDCCGYIAANLVLAYNDIAYEQGLVPSQYINYTNNTIRGEGLTKLLLQHGAEDPNGSSFKGTTAHRMAEIVREFLVEESTIQRPWQVTSWTFAINANGAISNNQPPILFGNFNAPDGRNVNHAVVAYGYSWGLFASGYRVHFGWSGKSDIWLSYNAIGSTMILSYF